MGRIILLRKKAGEYDKCDGCYFGPEGGWCNGAKVNMESFSIGGKKIINCYENYIDYIFVKLKEVKK